MKKQIVFAREQARIYRHHYKPSLNIFRFLRSILGVLITGTSPSAGHLRRK